MAKRFVSIWFRHLKTDWVSLRKPMFSEAPFVLTLADHGRVVISSTNAFAQKLGIFVGMALADAKAIVPELKNISDKPEPSGKLLENIARWCIRFSPVACIDPPEGIVLDATGCPHLWGGEENYIAAIRNRFSRLGYDTRIAIASTHAVAWAVAHFEKEKMIVPCGKEADALKHLQPAALRLSIDKLELLFKLGIRDIGRLMQIPHSTLRRRFGEELTKRLRLALGKDEEFLEPVELARTWQERLPALDPIVTAKGIEIALRTLLDQLCRRLSAEEKGIRMAIFSCYRVDGKLQQLKLNTNSPTVHVTHLFKLFEPNIETIEPALGIELFMLEAVVVENLYPRQKKIWITRSSIEDERFSEFLDRIASRIGQNQITRFLPTQRYWPERTFRPAVTLDEPIIEKWPLNRPRPVHLLHKPERIDVTAPIPDYPPMLFRHRGKLHRIEKADGPERIEPEWWLEQGEHRDYYMVEDEEGCRYWLFRLGHYVTCSSPQWFIHGFFA